MTYEYSDPFDGRGDLDDDRYSHLDKDDSRNDNEWMDEYDDFLDEYDDLEDDLPPYSDSGY